MVSAYTRQTKRRKIVVRQRITFGFSGVIYRRLCKMAIALSEKYWYLMPFAQIFVFMQEMNGMSKSRDTKKDKKTPPQKTPKEKKKAKQEKKKKI